MSSFRVCSILAVSTRLAPLHASALVAASGDNLLKKSENMGWWKGLDVEVGSEVVHVDTIYDVLDKMCRVPERPTTAPMRMPISGIYKIKGVGDVLAGRVEQGVVKPGEEESHDNTLDACLPHVLPGRALSHAQASHAV